MFPAAACSFARGKRKKTPWKNGKQASLAQKKIDPANNGPNTRRPPPSNRKSSARRALCLALDALGSAMRIFPSTDYPDPRFAETEGNKMTPNPTNCSQLAPLTSPSSTAGTAPQWRMAGMDGWTARHPWGTATVGVEWREGME